MENGKLFLALALGTIDREAEQRAALLGGNGGLEGCLVGLPMLTKTPLANEREAYKKRGAANATPLDYTRL